MKRLTKVLAGAAILSVAPLANAGFYVGAGIYNSGTDEKIDNVEFDETEGPKGTQASNVKVV